MPGPQTYSFDYSKIESHGFPISKDVRRGLGNEKMVPGPGAYDPRLKPSTP